MKRLSLRKIIGFSLILMLAASVLEAQVVIEAEDIPTEPGTETNFYLETMGDAGIEVDLGFDGPNREWSFLEGPTDNILVETLLDPEDTPFAEDFPNSNRVVTGSGFFGIEIEGSFVYQRVAEDGWYLDGLGIGENEFGFEVPVVFEEPILLLPLPAEYDMEWEIGETFEYFYTADTLAFDTLLVEIELGGFLDTDAWGSAEFPGGESDVLRLHSNIGLVVNGYAIQWIFGIRVVLPLGELYAIEAAHGYMWISPEHGEIASITSLPGETEPDFTEASSVRRRFLGEPGPVELVIPLQGNYFELISTCYSPEDLGADAVFEDVTGLTIAYQDNGSIYLPPFINTIGDIDVTRGYQLFCETDSELRIQGENIDPETEYMIEGMRWNWIGYPFDVETPVVDALSAIENDITIVMTDDGSIWIPPFVNTINNMQPGTGYFVFAQEDITFQYNAPAMFAGLGTHQTTSSTSLDVNPTGLPYAVMIDFADDTLLDEAAKIEVYDGLNLVGSSLVDSESEHHVVITWQGSPEHGLNGFVPGNRITVRTLASDGSELQVQQTGETNVFGKGAYATLTLDYQTLPSEFTVASGYPNPFNPSMMIPFTIPAAGDVKLAVYNVLGQQVYFDRRHFQAGAHELLFEAGNSNLVSGLYFVEVSFEEQRHLQKVTLLK
ncbi:T9SS type A sorting domain-containing protein [bacterium]|nr:T9SS type A sorting domain-containing protein [bacterium]